MNVAGRISRICPSEGWMEVEIERPSCSTCQKAQGCGLGNGAGSTGAAPIRLALMANAEEGKPVSLRIADKQLLQGVVSAYVLPLLLALTGAFIAEPLIGFLGITPGDPLMSTAAPAGFIAGLVLGIANLWRSGRRGVFGTVVPCPTLPGDEPR